MKFEKLVRDGQVAVLYSPGFGAGWYSWNTDHPGIAFDREIVEAVLAGKRDEAMEIAERKYPDSYTGGGGSLEIEWVPQGSRFIVDEYDGSESVTVLGPDTGLLA